MAGTDTKQKRDNNPSSALRDALTRRHTEAYRHFYEDLIQNCRDHLKQCHEPECLRCKDAEVLIPHYQDQMERAIRDYEARK